SPRQVAEGPPHRGGPSPCEHRTPRPPQAAQGPDGPPPVPAASYPHSRSMIAATSSAVTPWSGDAVEMQVHLLLRCLDRPRSLGAAGRAGSQRKPLLSS